MTLKTVTKLKRFWKVCRSSWMYDPFNTFYIWYCIALCGRHLLPSWWKWQLCSFNNPPHLCRLETVTWFVCGSWLGNAWLNMPPPSAPGQTAAGFAGLFQEELHVTWSTVTTKSLTFPPYPSRLIKPGAIDWWPQQPENTHSCLQIFALMR